jgi:hypothetical protein
LRAIGYRKLSRAHAITHRRRGAVDGGRVEGRARPANAADDGQQGTPLG